MNDIIYTSPGGTEFTAQQIIWSESFSHAAPSFSLANGTGDVHQDLGLFSSKFPIRFEFTDDEKSQSFYECIREIGPGTLTEPDTTNIRNVQPISITKTKGLVTDIGRTIYEVEFEENTVESVVESTQSLRQENFDLSESTMNLTADYFEARQKIDTGSESIRQIANFSKTLEDINENISANVSALEDQIDLIVQSPINALISTKRLMELPGIAYNRVKNKLEGYAALVARILELDESQSAESQTQQKNDAFYIESMGAMALNAMSNNVIDSEYKTKKEALTVADLLVSQYVDYRDKLDSIQSAGVFSQDGSIQQSLSKLIYNTVGLIFQLSFSLKTELIFTTDKKLTMYDIAAEYYPEEWKEDEISLFDFIAETNDFTGDDFIYLRSGREVKVYV